MNRFIVVEGPDGAGKSTLCEKLQVHFKWPIIHGGGPLTSRLDFLDRVRTKGWGDTQLKICDRVSYISERVYAKEPLVSSLETKTWIERMKPIVIFCCLDTSEDMVERISEKTKAHKPREQIEKVKQDHPFIVRRYRTVMMDIPHIYFNWMRHDFRNLLTQVNQCAA